MSFLTFSFCAISIDDSIVIKITVPGVAESYPLLTVGDFVRLVFRGGSHEARGRELVTEVIGEIADVVIKTEEVTLRLPSPFQYVWNPRKGPHQELTTYNCFPYLQALLYIEDFWIDATPIMNALPHLPPQKKGTANKIPEDSRNNVLNRFRFDVRFGFLGGRGFDIINRSFTEATMAPVSGSYGYHLSRCLAPIRAHLNWHSNKNAAVYCFQNPLNLEQRKAVMDIVCNKNGSAPYVIEGPAGTGKLLCSEISLFFLPWSKHIDLLPSRKKHVRLRGSSPSVKGATRRKDFSVRTIRCSLRRLGYPPSPLFTRKDTGSGKEQHWASCKN